MWVDKQTKQINQIKWITYGLNVINEKKLYSQTALIYMLNYALNEFKWKSLQQMKWCLVGYTPPSAHIQTCVFACAHNFKYNMNYALGEWLVIIVHICNEGLNSKMVFDHIVHTLNS